MKKVILAALVFASINAFAQSGKRYNVTRSCPFLTPVEEVKNTMVKFTDDGSTISIQGIGLSLGNLKAHSWNTEDGSVGFTYWSNNDGSIRATSTWFNGEYNMLINVNGCVITVH